MTVSGIDQPYTTSYTYDKNNRMTKESKVYSTGGNKEETEYYYDPNGNMISKAKGEWKSTTAAMSFSYTYDAGGLRQSKTVNGVTTNHIWDGMNMVAETNGSNAVTSVYTRGIDLILSKNGTAVTYYLHNRHGDVNMLMNEDGSITKTYSYDAFGVEQNKSASDTNPFRYSGEYYDKETDNIYLRARYYDPATSRMLSEDPIRSGTNWYVYCENNPINRIDPTGLDSWVFYDGEAFGEQAKTEAKNLEIAYGTEVHLIDIWSLEGFLYNWDNMISSDDSIDGVSMLFHGSPYTIYLGTDGEGNAQQLTSSVENVTPNGSTGYYVGNLKKATMQSLNVMTCNGGHLDLIYANEDTQKRGFNHNIAVELLLTQDTSIVYGMDGSLAYTEIFGNYYPRLAWDQEHYKSWTPSRKYLGKRQPSGKIKFWINDSGGVGYWPMWQY